MTVGWIRYRKCQLIVRIDINTGEIQRGQHNRPAIDDGEPQIAGYRRSIVGTVDIDRDRLLTDAAMAIIGVDRKDVLNRVVTAKCLHEGGSVIKSVGPEARLVDRQRAVDAGQEGHGRIGYIGKEFRPGPVLAVEDIALWTEREPAAENPTREQIELRGDCVRAGYMRQPQYDLVFLRRRSEDDVAQDSKGIAAWIDVAQLHREGVAVQSGDGKLKRVVAGLSRRAISERNSIPFAKIIGYGELESSFDREGGSNL